MICATVCVTPNAPCHGLPTVTDPPVGPCALARSELASEKSIVTTISENMNRLFIF
jgi:hypothetical protein